MIKTKQIFQPVEASDGTRILITCRGDKHVIACFDEHISALGPSLDLLSAYKGWGEWENNPITWDEYTEVFLREMKSRASRDAIERLAKRSARGEVITLLCYEKESNPHCHRHIVKKLICEKISSLFQV